ncbi:hypothetical protein ACC764_18520 [Rhizobium ruizarguesonis]
MKQKNSSDGEPCRICGGSPTIKAHLMPEAFVKEIYHSTKSDEQHMIVFNETGHKSASKTGRYERGLLCASCDGKLGAYEGSALELLKRLRSVKVGKKSGTDAAIRSGLYEFRVPAPDVFVRFACGILWKYSSIDSTIAGHLRLGSIKDQLEGVCFGHGPIPDSIDVFLERDLFAYLAFDDPEEVYFYATPSVNQRGGRRTAWFSLGGFIIYVRIDEGGPSDYAPKRSWLKGRKACKFVVNMRSIMVNQGIARSIGYTADDLARLNKRFTPRS